MELADLTRGMGKNEFLEPEKWFFRKASIFFKLLAKSMFQVPKSTHILILCGLEVIQACAEKTICRSLKNCFFAKPDFIP